VFVGPNGVGKSMLAQNIAHQAVIDGHTVLCTSAGQLLGNLCALDSDSTPQRRLGHYARTQLLVIDEVGYLSYPNRHADILFQLILRRSCPATRLRASVACPSPRPKHPPSWHEGHAHRGLR
jgi:DNA replication protein DnaC